MSMISFKNSRRDCGVEPPSFTASCRDALSAEPHLWTLMTVAATMRSLSLRLLTRLIPCRRCTLPVEGFTPLEVRATGGRYVSRSRKEVFQPHLPVRLPCYDLAPVTCLTLGRSLRSRTSGTPSFHGLTGGVYKARERIHRAMADARLLANPASRSRVADSDPN